MPLQTMLPNSRTQTPNTKDCGMSVIGAVSVAFRPDTADLVQCCYIYLCFAVKMWDAEHFSGFGTSNLHFLAIKIEVHLIFVFVGELFNNPQFLQFSHQVLALSIGSIVISVKQQPRHSGPLYKYSYCSLSLLISSWCQYEALKFVSFPTQVLCKASKVIAWQLDMI